MPAADPSSSTPWSGHLALTPGMVIYTGPGGNAGHHSHHAIQLIRSFDSCFELVSEGIAMKLMSSCGHEADGLVRRLNGQTGDGRLGNQIMMALLYFPPAILFYGALASKRGSVRTLLRDFRRFSSTFNANRAGKDPVPESSTQPVARVS